MPRPTAETLFKALCNRPLAPQGELFASKRVLPVMKSGPEDAFEKPRMPIWSQAMLDKQTRH